LNKPNLNIFSRIQKPFAIRAYKLITIVITLYLLAGCTSSGPSEPEAKLAPVSPQILQENDQLFQQRQDLSNLRTAIANLIRARREFARTYDLEWRLAKYNYYLGRHSTDQKEKEKAFDDGQAAGTLAIKLDPGKPEGHFWYGANLGAQANENPLTAGVTSVNAIRDAMNKVIELQPGYEMASAYDVLGQLELGTRMLGGSAEKAVDLFEKGIELEKLNGEMRIHLAEAYLTLNRNSEAKKQLEYVLQMKPNPAYLPEYAQQVEKAKKLLETRF
jgi:tetratricopeptide (TPR) repeat protein